MAFSLLKFCHLHLQRRWKVLTCVPFLLFSFPHKYLRISQGPWLVLFLFVLISRELFSPWFQFVFLCKQSSTSCFYYVYLIIFSSTTLKACWELNFFATQEPPNLAIFLVTGTQCCLSPDCHPSVPSHHLLQWNHVFPLCSNLSAKSKLPHICVILSILMSFLVSASVHFSNYVILI